MLTFKVINSIIGSSGTLLWNLFLVVSFSLGSYIIYSMLKERKLFIKNDDTAWSFKKISDALSISISSKIGTGAVIGVLAALWKTSDAGLGGEAIVAWVIIGMALLLPLTYAEVLFTQILRKMPREFISFTLNKKMATIYSLALITLYSFGFVGFQFTGIHSVVSILSEKTFQHTMQPHELLIYIILPMVIITALIIITKNHHLFTSILGSLISIVVVLYLIMFVIFLVKTSSFIPTYFNRVMVDFLDFRTAALGIPTGLILAAQRIMQISETLLGTSALSASDCKTSPHKEAITQVLATLFTLFIAVAITSYIYSYGRYNIQGVTLTGNGLERIKGYIETIQHITGHFGLIVVLLFFTISGYCTVLGSFHFLNKSVYLSKNGKIILYLLFISISGILSISHFNVIFDIVDLLMFVVGLILITSLFQFCRKKNTLLAEKPEL